MPLVKVTEPLSHWITPNLSIQTLDHQMAGWSFRWPIVPPYYIKDCRISKWELPLVCFNCTFFLLFPFFESIESMTLFSIYSNESTGRIKISDRRSIWRKLFYWAKQLRSVPMNGFRSFDVIMLLGRQRFIVKDHKKSEVWV